MIASVQVARRVHAVSTLVDDAAASAWVDKRLQGKAYFLRRIHERIALAVARGNALIQHQWIERQGTRVPAVHLVNQVQLAQRPPAPIWPALFAPVGIPAVI